MATGRRPFAVRPPALVPAGTGPPCWAGAVLISGAGAYIALFIVTALFRLAYPFPLEGTEPASLTQVERIVAGQPLYVEPTLEHVPLVYGPIYFYASAVVASVLGPTYTALRLVSLLASIGSIALVFRFVQRETASARCALVAAGLLAASNPLAQTAMDLGRVDALFTCFILAGAYAARTASLEVVRGRWAMLCASGGLFGLAAFTKSPLAGIPIAGAVFVFLALTPRRQALAFAFGLAVCGALILLVLRAQTGPWATWYLWDLPRQHAFGRDLIGRFWFSDVLPRFTLPLALGPLFLVGSASRGDRRPALFYGLLLLAMISVAWASRANGGGAENVVLPAAAALAILFGVGLDELLRQSASANRGSAVQTYVLVLGILQLALLAYNPRTVVPLRTNALADDKLAAAIGALPGPVFAPDFAGYMRAAERREQPLLSAVFELQGGYGGTITAEGERWNAALERALDERRFRYVVLRRTDCCYEDRVLGAGYVYQGSPFADDDDFYSWRTPRTPDPKIYVAP